LARSPAKQIYDEIIIPDLLEAEKSTLPWKDASGKVSMGAVKSILADVYLTYAGAAINGGAAAYAESAKRSLRCNIKMEGTPCSLIYRYDKPGK
jgi:hypothetical protein